MIAPERYLASVTSSGLYDCEISYEKIHSYFVSQGGTDKRCSYKANVILEGIRRNRRGYQPVEDEQVTNFVKQYFDYTNEKHPALRMQTPKSRQARSSWIEFYPDVLPRKELSLCHQMTNGEVKLVFKGQVKNMEAIRAKYQNRLSGGMAIEKAGQSAKILMRVPSIYPQEQSFEEVKGKIDIALDCLSRLARIPSYTGSQGESDKRSAYKANVILTGIGKNRRGYQPVENEQVTNFVKQYYDYANAKYPALRMQEAKSRQARSSWIEFYPDNLPRRELSLCHQMTNGEVKLVFKGQVKNIEAIRAKYQSRLSEKMTVERAGQSAKILMRVPNIYPLKQRFEDVKGEIDIALDCLSRLARFLSKM
jgi:hypothetical protein